MPAPALGITECKKHVLCTISLAFKVLAVETNFLGVGSVWVFGGMAWAKGGPDIDSAAFLFQMSSG